MIRFIFVVLLFLSISGQPVHAASPCLDVLGVTKSLVSQVKDWGEGVLQRGRFAIEMYGVQKSDVRLVRKAIEEFKIDDDLAIRFWRFAERVSHLKRKRIFRNLLTQSGELSMTRLQYIDWFEALPELYRTKLESVNALISFLKSDTPEDVMALVDVIDSAQYLRDYEKADFLGRIRDYQDDDRFSFTLNDWTEVTLVSVGSSGDYRSLFALVIRELPISKSSASQNEMELAALLGRPATPAEIEETAKVKARIEEASRMIERLSAIQGGPKSNQVVIEDRNSNYHTVKALDQLVGYYATGVSRYTDGSIMNHASVLRVWHDESNDLYQFDLWKSHQVLRWRSVKPDSASVEWKKLDDNHSEDTKYSGLQKRPDYRLWIKEPFSPEENPFSSAPGFSIRVIDYRALRTRTENDIITDLFAGSLFKFNPLNELQMHSLKPFIPHFVESEVIDFQSGESQKREKTDLNDFLNGNYSPSL